MPDYRPAAPEHAPTADELLDVFRRSVPEEYWAGLQESDSYALFRALANQWAVLARAQQRAIEARYYLPSAMQSDEPGTEARFATGSVTLTREADAQHALVAEPGQLVLEAVGRLYVNVDRISWAPGEQQAVTGLFRCDVPCAAGNLDHLANPDGTLDLDLIQLFDLSRGRANINGSLLAGIPTTAQDSGVDDLFAPEDVGLYLRVNSSANPASVGQVRKTTGFNWPATELPVGSGRYPRQLFLDDYPQENPLEVLVWDGAVYTDETQDASTAEGDVSGFTGVAPSGLLVGHTRPFNSVVVRVSQPGDGDWDVTWQYWDGSSWESLTQVVDPTNGWRPAAVGEFEISWSVPVDWAAVASPGATGVSPFYVRALVSTHTSSTTAPLLSRVVVRPYTPLVAEDQTLTWALLDYKDRGVTIQSCEAFSGGRDDDLYLLGDERGLYRQDNETADSFRRRVTQLLDCVSPNAVLRAANRGLAPFGYQAEVIDVGDGLTGFFADEDAADYYEPGDAYPEDPWKLALSEEETRWFFIVLVPYLHQGDWGLFADDGPVLFDEPHQEWLGAVGHGFADGYPVDAYAAYAALWSSINKIRMGGVNFTLVRSLELNTPSC